MIDVQKFKKIDDLIQGIFEEYWDFHFPNNNREELDALLATLDYSPELERVIDDNLEQAGKVCLVEWSDWVAERTTYIKNPNEKLFAILKRHKFRIQREKTKDMVKAYNRAKYINNK